MIVRPWRPTSITALKMFRVRRIFTHLRQSPTSPKIRLIHLRDFHDNFSTFTHERTSHIMDDIKVPLVFVPTITSWIAIIHLYNLGVSPEEFLSILNSSNVSVTYCLCIPLGCSALYSLYLHITRRAVARIVAFRTALLCSVVIRVYMTFTLASLFEKIFLADHKWESEMTKRSAGAAFVYCCLDCAAVTLWECSESEQANSGLVSCLTVDPNKWKDTPNKEPKDMSCDKKFDQKLPVDNQHRRYRSGHTATLIHALQFLLRCQSDSCAAFWHAFYLKRRILSRHWRCCCL